MMYLKQVLSITAIAQVSASNNHSLRNNGHRTLQGSLGCMMSGESDFFECCPEADPNDGICTMLWCVDAENVAVRDACGCGQVKKACEQLAQVIVAVQGLPGICDTVTTCCTDEEGDNVVFNECMGTTMKENNMKKPDFNALLPNGLPDFPDDSVDAEDKETHTEHTPGDGHGNGDDKPEDEPISSDGDDADGEGGTDSTEGTVEGDTDEEGGAGDTTVATEGSADAAEEPEPLDDTPEETAEPMGSSANTYAISALASVIGSSLIMLYA
mmetsp:Transcript_35940/g.61316  ORF Transcript_35940/g.61316 Transcript_35940/m.61316 type:complete len:270 (-) Transcript_35940:219-1028(-)